MLISHIKFDKKKQQWHLIINKSSMMNDFHGLIYDDYLQTIKEILEKIEELNHD